MLRKAFQPLLKASHGFALDLALQALCNNEVHIGSITVRRQGDVLSMDGGNTTSYFSALDMRKVLEEVHGK